MRSVAGRRFPIPLIILFVLGGIAAAVTIGSYIAPDAGDNRDGQHAYENG